MHAVNQAQGRTVSIESLENRTLMSGSAIVGFVYRDLNGDGIHSSSEPAFPHVRVFLDQDGDGKFDSNEKNVLTGSDGQYAFGKLAAGRYTVCEELPVRWRSSEPRSRLYRVSVGAKTVAERNFFNTQCGLITGTLFNDWSRDGQRTLGERGLSGWRVYIDADGDGQYQRNEQSVLTGATGQWSFSNLGRGSYIIRISKPQGWEQTTPADNAPFVVGVTAATVVNGKIFGAADFSIAQQHG